MSGTTGLMQALTVACGETEDRGSFRFLLNRSRPDSRFHPVPRAFVVRNRVDSCGTGLAGVTRFLAVHGIVYPVADSRRDWLHWLSIGYRSAPSRSTRRWINAGAIAASLLWIIGSSGFSLYVTRFGSYDKTYGSLGAVVILLIWFYLTAFCRFTLMMAIKAYSPR